MGRWASKWISKFRAKENPKQPYSETKLEYKTKKKIHLDYQAREANVVETKSRTIQEKLEVSGKTHCKKRL